jgi:hypothetical protein
VSADELQYPQSLRDHLGVIGGRCSAGLAVEVGKRAGG